MDEAISFFNTGHTAGLIDMAMVLGKNKTEIKELLKEYFITDDSLLKEICEDYNLD